MLGRTSATGRKQGVAPALFSLIAASRRYAMAYFPDGTHIGNPDLFPDAGVRRAKPGDIITVFATGFGATDPPYPDGQVIRGPAPLRGEIAIGMDGIPAVIHYAGIISAGIYQINIRVPDLLDGDAALSVQVLGSDVQDQAYVSIQK